MVERKDRGLIVTERNIMGKCFGSMTSFMCWKERDLECEKKNGIDQSMV